MAERVIIPDRTQATVRLVAPTNVSDPLAPNPLDNTTDGATSTFKVYDDAKNEILSAAEAGGQTILSVTDAGVFVVGETVEVTLDSAAVTNGAVTVVDAAAGTITLGTGLASAAAAGNRVRTVLGGGSPIAMSEYGTPKLGRLDWGFSGTLVSTLAGRKVRQLVSIEISFLGSGGGTPDLVRVICAEFKPVEDCT